MKDNNAVVKTRSPLRAIRLKCYECSSENWNDVKECPIKECALYPFRHGKRLSDDIKVGDAL